MKIKTSELIGKPLDWAVAKCEGNIDWEPEGNHRDHYSTDWAQGGPILEREKICPCPSSHAAGSPWSATDLTGHITHFGPTALVAVMRCRVASTLGDEVDVQEELL